VISALLDRFGRLTPRLVYALAMNRELVVTLPVATAPPRPRSLPAVPAAGPAAGPYDDPGSRRRGALHTRASS